MPRRKTPSFVTELELIADSSSRHELKARFNAGFRLFNGIQSELLTRMQLVRLSPEWEAAKKLPKKIKDKQGVQVSNPKRVEAFQNAKKQYRFTKVEAEKYGKLIAERSIWMREKLDSVVIQTLAERAFKAVDKILLGRAKKVRFKNNRSFSSIQGKQITTSIRVALGKDDGQSSLSGGN